MSSLPIEIDVPDEAEGDQVSLTTYTYDKSDFGSRKIHCGRLMRSIRKSTIHPTKFLNGVFYNVATEQVEVTFEQALDADEMTVLDNALSVHDGATAEAADGATWLLSDVKKTGSHAGTAHADAWIARTLNTITGSVSDTCVLENNQITLAPGTYKIEAKVPAFFVKSHVARVYNVDKSIVEATGSAAHATQIDLSKGYTATQTIAGVDCIVQVGDDGTGDAETFEIQQYCSNAHDRSGLGRANGIAGTDEVYATVTVYKNA